ncbi:MAG: hypothetical protein QOF84_5507 [Streptomyces sp.]|jgi:hypothetical protein|nr:hypothetical protein [Streptomyces sp.]MDX6350717.1 hypothetical protein [Streptomyces sp.]
MAVEPVSGCDVCGRDDGTVRDCGIRHIPLAVCDGCFADMATARHGATPRPLSAGELLAAARSGRTKG